MEEIRAIISELEKMLDKVNINDDETYFCLKGAIESLTEIKIQDHDGNKF